MSFYNILIVDDEKDINNLVYTSLVNYKYECKQVYTMKDAKNEIFKNIYSLVILDLMLPDGDGLALLQICKNNNIKIPFIILSAKDNFKYIDKGLEIGAIDYITKPFRINELLLRVRNILDISNIVKDVYFYKNITLDRINKNIFIDNKQIILTNKEFKVFFYILSSNTNSVSKTDLYYKVWGYIDDINIHRLESTISNIRKKCNKYHPNLIKYDQVKGFYFE